MNWVDILILVTLAWFTYSAFSSGLIREVVTIAGAVLGVALAGLFYLELSEDVGVAVSDDRTAQIIAFGIIFGSTVLASQLIALFLKQAASLLLLGLFDSVGGAIIGFLKGFVFIEIALIAAVTFTSLGLVSAVSESVLAPLFLDLLPILAAILPNEFKNAVEAF